jgi:nucleoside phosphorylase
MQRLRDMSTEMRRANELHQRATIGIITALPKEFSAVEIMLNSPVTWSAKGEGAGRQFVLGEIPAASSGAHVVALALLADIGTTSAAVSATSLLLHFPSIRHIIMCGIAGGIPVSPPASPEDDVRLGDIVVSDRNGIVSYDFIKQTATEIQERSPPRPPGAELLQAVQFLEAKRLKFQRPWEEFLDRANQLEDALRPRDDHGADGNPIKYMVDSKRRPGLPRVFSGPIASANRLLKNEEFRDELRRRFKTKAVEMEGSGVADAAWWSDRAGYLVVRGICDFCDMRKGDLWQGYAAVAAAAYVRALLESMPAASARRGIHDEPAAGLSQVQPSVPIDVRAPSKPESTAYFTAEQKLLQGSSTYQASAPGPQSPASASDVRSSQPAITQPRAKPTQARRSTSPWSAPGCIGITLFLVAGAVGLIALPRDTTVDPKNKRSLLAGLSDGLKSPSPAGPLAPTGPPSGIHMSSEGLSGLRRLHRVRALQDAENGQSLRTIPTGSFGYIEPQQPEYLPNARVSASQAGGTLEVHKLAGGSAMIIGFAQDADVRAISLGGTARLVLSRTASAQARTAVAIPIEFIRSLYFKNQGDIQFDLISSSISHQ